MRTCETTNTGCTVGFEEIVQRPFTRVAGRAIGYQVGTPEAFVRTIILGSANLEGVYVDGLSVTYSTSLSPMNNHIWTFAAGVTETHTNRFGCPCVGGLDSSLPDFLQDSYFCESAASSISLEHFLMVIHFGMGKIVKVSAALGALLLCPCSALLLKK